jgi:hypothetical protein
MDCVLNVLMLGYPTGAPFQPKNKIPPSSSIDFHVEILGVCVIIYD